jgi:hypothetical protein
LQRAGDRRNAWTLGGIAIDQVSKYSTRRSVPGRRIMAGAKTRDARARPLVYACSSLPTKVRLLMVQTFIYSAVMYGAEVGHDEGGQRQDVSGRRKLAAF